MQSNDIYKRWFRHALQLPSSPNPAEREALILGRGEADGAPFYLPLKLLTEHMHVEGPAGAGKTSSLCAVLEQIALRAQHSIVVLDLKGDSNELLGAVSTSSLPVRWFIDRVGWSSFTMSIFEQRSWMSLTPGQKAGTIGAALGSTHGLASYGKQWYGGAAYRVMQHVFERADVKSFRGLAEAIHHFVIDGKKRDLHSDIRAAGLQAYLDTSRMGAIQALNTVGNPHGIDLCTLFETPQVLYVCLPSGVSHEQAGAVFRLFLFGLFDAAAHVKNRIPLLVFGDEFQLALESGLATVLRLARSCNIGMVLSNQALEELCTPERDYRPTMKACCRLHWQFGEPNPELQRELSETGGTYLDIEETKSQEWSPLSRSHRITTGWTQRVVDRQRLPINEIKRVTGDPRLSFFTSSGDYGLYCYGPYPQIVWSDYHISREEYERRRKMPWPAAVEGCIVTEMPGLTIDTPEPDEVPPPVPRIGRPARTQTPSKPPRRE